MTTCAKLTPFFFHQGAFLYNDLSSAKLTNTYVDGPTMVIGESTAAQSDIFYGSGDFTCSSSCGVGQYGSCSTMGSCVSCEVDVCLSCPSGKWGHKSGGTSEEDGCTATTEGYFTDQSGATVELLCGSGKYVSDHENDNDGFGVPVEGTHCVEWYDYMPLHHALTNLVHCRYRNTTTATTSAKPHHPPTPIPTATHTAQKGCLTV